MSLVQFIWLYVILSTIYCVSTYAYKVFNKEIWEKSKKKSNEMWDKLISDSYVHLGIKKEEWPEFTEEDQELEDKLVKWGGIVFLIFFGWFMFPFLCVRVIKGEQEE